MTIISASLNSLSSRIALTSSRFESSLAFHFFFGWFSFRSDGVPAFIASSYCRDIVTQCNPQSNNRTIQSHFTPAATRWNVIRGGVWIGNRIYWTLDHTTCDYTLQITITQRLVFSVTIFTAMLGDVFLCLRAHVLADWLPSQTNRLLF
jgi:hypothetical protein